MGGGGREWRRTIGIQLLMHFIVVLQARAETGQQLHKVTVLPFKFY